MALGFVGVAVFAATLPMTRLAVPSLGPEFLTAARALIAGLIGLPVLMLRAKPIPRRELPALALTALCLVLGFPGLTSFAMRGLPASHAGVITGALPLATVVVSALIDGERPSAAFWVCAIAGCALVIAFALHHGGSGLRQGDALLFAAMAVAAVGYALSARLSRRLSALDVISWQVVLSLPFSLVAAIAWRPADLAAPPASAWAALAYLGVMSMYLGFVAWNSGMALGGVARVSQVQLSQSFLTIGISAVLLGERIDAETVIAAILIVSLVFLTRRLRVRRPADSP
jgi:drug/metabolite transporter (DMT)-like permease